MAPNLLTGMPAPKPNLSLPDIPEQGDSNEFLTLAGGLVIFTIQGLSLYRSILAEVGLPHSKLAKVKSRKALRELHVEIANLRTRAAAVNLQNRLGQGRLEPLYLQAGKLLLRGRLRQGLRLLTQRVPD